MGSDAFNIARLIAGYLRGELSPEEQEAFQKWLQEKESNRSLLESFRKGEAVQEEINFMDKIDTGAAWKKIKKSRKASAAERLGRYAAYAAAALILLVGAGVWIHSFRNPAKTRPATAILYRNDVKPGGNKARLVLSDGRQVRLGNGRQFLNEQGGTRISGNRGELTYSKGDAVVNSLVFNTLIVPKAGTYRVVLPDGTKVWVNAMSELRFPVKFNNKERRVYLKGEAYFEVAAETGRPFTVTVNHTDVAVLGTHFNVNAYSPVTNTTLLEGSVKVSGYGRQKLLLPGQQARVSEDFAVVEPADVTKAVSWKNGDFLFKGDRMPEIAQQLARWYDLDVEYRGPVPGKTYSGIIKRSANLSQVLEMLQFVSDARFEVNGRQLIIKFK